MLFAKHIFYRFEMSTNPDEGDTVQKQNARTALVAAYIFSTDL